MSNVYVYPQEFDRCVALLRRKLEEIATRAGVPESECETLESTLAALSPFSRERAAVVLEGISVQSGDEFPAMSFAASYVRQLAREVWENKPADPARALAGRAAERTNMP
jgi:hypothetical protein